LANCPQKASYDKGLESIYGNFAKVFEEIIKHIRELDVRD